MRAHLEGVEKTNSSILDAIAVQLRSALGAAIAST